MKKFLALMLAAMLLVSCTAALAETATDESITVAEPAYAFFDVTMVIPEEYTMEEYRFEEMLFMSITSEAENTPNYIITIAPSEAYEGITLNELDEEEKKTLLDSMDDDFMQPELNDLTTEHGTEVYLVNEVAPDCEGGYYASGFTLYKGYFIQIYAAKPNYEPLAKEDLDLAMKILSDMEFVDAK